MVGVGELTFRGSTAARPEAGLVASPERHVCGPDDRFEERLIGEVRLGDHGAHVHTVEVNQAATEERRARQKAVGDAKPVSSAGLRRDRQGSDSTSSAQHDHHGSHLACVGTSSVLAMEGHVGEQDHAGTDSSECHRLDLGQVHVRPIALA